ncbi:MAG: CDP-4-dehydro-6-deoxyglucose reductase [Oleispira sp.]|jgi:CDP-4-dehydro-6-deoxyglucose reductase
MTSSTAFFTVTFQPSNISIQVAENQALQEACFEQGVIIPLSCENGVCQICEAKLISGIIDQRQGYQVEQQKGEILESLNQVLLCLTYPLSDLEIFMPEIFAPGHSPEKNLACQVLSVEALNTSVYRIELLAPAGSKLDYLPGQYLEMHIVGQKLPYSIANAPDPKQPRRLELQISDHSEVTASIISELSKAAENRSTVKINIAKGDCFLNELPKQPILLVCAGTGFSQIQCLAEAILAKDPEHEVHLYWSNRSLDEFYLYDIPKKWADEFTNFSFHPVLEAGIDSWQGRAGWIYEVIHEDFKDLSDVQMYACGSPNMVHGTLDQLEKLGLSEANMHSDVFSYAPRDTFNKK